MDGSAVAKWLSSSRAHQTASLPHAAPSYSRPGRNKNQNSEESTLLGYTQASDTIASCIPDIEGFFDGGGTMTVLTSVLVHARLEPLP